MSPPIRRLVVFLSGAACVLAVACGEEQGAVDPVEVAPGDGVDEETTTVADTIPPRDDSTGPGAGTAGAIWVEDAQGQAAGVLVRRGSDDNIADRALYDFVTLFHPGVTASSRVYKK